MDHRQSLYPLTSASRFTPAVEPPDRLKAFSLKIEQEFIQGSAIDPDLFQAAVRLCQDLETTATGDVETLIHEALNWCCMRFGQRGRDPLQAALLLNKDCSCWQAKLDSPLIDSCALTLRSHFSSHSKSHRIISRLRQGIALPALGGAA